MSNARCSTRTLVGRVRGRVIFVSHSRKNIAFYKKRPLLRPKPLLSLLHHYKRQKVRQTISAALFTQPRVMHSIVSGYRLLLISLGRVSSTGRTGCYNIPGRLVLSGLQVITRTERSFCLHVPLVRNIGTSRRGVAHDTTFLTSLP